MSPSTCFILYNRLSKSSWPTKKSINVNWIWKVAENGWREWRRLHSIKLTRSRQQSVHKTSLNTGLNPTNKFWKNSETLIIFFVYSNHLNTKHLNTGFIWIQDSMGIWNSNDRHVTWQTIWIPDILNHKQAFSFKFSIF